MLSSEDKNKIELNKLKRNRGEFSISLPEKWSLVEDRIIPLIENNGDVRLLYHSQRTKGNTHLSLTKNMEKGIIFSEILIWGFEYATKQVHIQPRPLIINFAKE